MSTKRRPGPIDCYATAEEDEPMFILLGRDQDAPLLVELWAMVRSRAGEDPSVVAEALKVAGEMKAYRRRREMKRLKGEEGFRKMRG